MKKALIGVIPLYDEERESIWMIPGYMKGLEEAGGIPFILPFSDKEDNIKEICEMIDGLLITGGQDINPILYNEDKNKKCGNVCDVRDRMEILYLDEMMRLNKPVFGICRGIQILNVYMGGNLYQDIESQVKSNINHCQNPPYDRSVHKVEVMGKLRDIYESDEIEVNSYHHQGIKKLGDGLEVLSIAEDGIIEAVLVKDKKFIMAVQWHPEFMFEKYEKQRKLFEVFVSALKE